VPADQWVFRQAVELVSMTDGAEGTGGRFNAAASSASTDLGHPVLDTLNYLSVVEGNKNVVISFALSLLRIKAKH
jgi:hypothetical protein